MRGSSPARALVMVTWRVSAACSPVTRAPLWLRSTLSCVMQQRFVGARPMNGKKSDDYCCCMYIFYNSSIRSKQCTAVVLVQTPYEGQVQLIFLLETPWGTAVPSTVEPKTVHRPGGQCSRCPEKYSSIVITWHPYHVSNDFSLVKSKKSVRTSTR